MDPSRDTAFGELVPHSCEYCQKIDINYGIPTTKQLFRYEEVCEAVSYGCDLFRERQSKVPLQRINLNQQLLLEIYFEWTDCIQRMHFQWLDDKEKPFDDDNGDWLPLFALKGSAAAPFVKTRPLNKEPSSNNTYYQVNRWLQGCLNHHRKCKEAAMSHSSGFTPTRLISVGSKDSVLVYIQETSKKELQPYSALTYCWGGDQKIKTTRVTIQEGRREIQFTELPRTIQNAIEITRELGIPYLWVDSLCIVQDDAEDARREIAKMAYVYMGAIVTISAATANHSGKGFLQKRNLSGCYVAMYELPFRGPKDVFGSIFSSEGSINSSDDEEVDLRAWTMQEHMLPLRLLRYGSRQVEWKCLREHRTDGGTVYDEFPPDDTYFHGSPFQANFKRPAVGESGVFDINGTLDNWVYFVKKFSLLLM